MLCARAQLVAGFTESNAAGCSPITVTFTNTSTTTGPVLFTWDLGKGGTPVTTTDITQTESATYTTPGVYTVVLTATSGTVTSNYSLTVTVYNNPVVRFTESPRSGCTPLPVTFTSTSAPGSGTISGYTWDFGDGSTTASTGPDTTHTYKTAINPTVTLTVTNTDGCSAFTKQSNIIPFPPPKANFSGDSTLLCQLSNAEQFTNMSTGNGPLSYTWNFGDGTTSTAAAPAHTYTQKGLYTVSLVAMTAKGCADTFSRANYIDAADFTPAFHVGLPVCAGEPVVFADSSYPTASVDNWTFGDNGSTATGGTVQHTFAAAGTYPVTLTGTFGTCLAGTTSSVTVNPLPFQKGFIVTPATACGVVPEQVTFRDTTAAAVQWAWYSGDPANPAPFGTQQSATHTYTQNGIYHPSLTLISAAGCTDTVSGVVVVGTDSAALNIQAAVYNSCTSVTVQCSATAPIPIASYQWNFGDGTTSASASPLHSYTSPGVYHISLTFVNTSGCTTTTTWTDSIQIWQPPQADLILVGSPVVCGSTPVNFILRTTNATGLLVLPGTGMTFPASDSEWAYRYQTPGTYTVTLIASNAGCSDTVVKPDLVTVSDAFAKILSETYTCDGTRGLVTFTDSVTAGATAWSWNFGDGAVVTGTSAPPATIAHTYTKSGLYSAFLYITGGLQCNVYDGMSVPVLLKQNPVLSDNGISAVCAGNSLQVEITGVDTNYRDPYGPGMPFDYSFVTWQYGDGTLLDEANYGSYGVSFSNQLYYFTSGKDSLRFISQSDGFGCYDTSNWVPVKVVGPIASIILSATQQCYKTPLTLTDSSYETDGVPIVEWEWSFGDGTGDTLSTNATVTHTYSSPNLDYYPNVTVVDSAGCRSTSGYPQTNYRVTMNGPQAAFSWSPPNITPGTTAVFTNNTQGPVSDVLWTFQSDGSTSTNLVSVSHTYPNITVDTVTLIAYNNTPGYCASDTDRQAVPVSYVTASFTTSAQYLSKSNCPPLQVTCTSTTFDVSQYSWNFGDGSPLLTVPDPTHTYSKAGKYYITLNATGLGTTITVVDSVTVGGPFGIPVVNIPQGCSPSPVIITASSLEGVVSYTLDFGDGTVLTEQPPDTVNPHVYTTAGIYSPILTVQDAEGCMVPYYLPAPVVVDSLHAAFLPDRSRVCDSGLVSYAPTVYSLSATQPGEAQPGDTLRYHWNFGTGNPGDTSDGAAPSFDYTTPGKYIVQFSVASVPGCSVLVTDSILVVQSARGIISAPDSGCAGLPISFGATPEVSMPAGPPPAGSVLTYQWFFPGTGTSTAQNPPPISLAPGNDTILLVVSLNGCFDTSSVTLSIFANPIGTLTPADTTICLGSAVSLQASGGTTYQWGDTAGLSSYTIASPVAQPKIPSTYTVQIGNTHGCSVSDSAVIRVVPSFTLKVTPDTTVCLGDSLRLNVSGAFTYQWITSGSISDTASADPILTPVTTTVYTVVGYDSAFCFTDTATVNVSVSAKPTVTVPPVSPVTGGSIVLEATGSADVVSWSWSPATYLNCTTCADPVCTPQRDITYTVTGTTAEGCTASDSVVVPVVCMASNVRIPQAFTPNNDGMNDFFYPMGQGVTLVKEFRIFGRWGNLVFEAHDTPFGDPGSGWDGRSGGKDQPTGAYVYDILLQCITGETFELKGTVLLER